MGKKIHYSKLATEIAASLSKYEETVAEQLKDEVQQIAKECAKEIASKSPKDTGVYAKGWTHKVLYEKGNDIRVTVYNKNKPTLTHLLENGHALANGGRKNGKPHIRPAERNAAQKLLNKAKVVVKCN